MPKKDRKGNREFPGGSEVRTLSFSLPSAQVQSLVRELRSHTLHNVAKKKKVKQ